MRDPLVRRPEAAGSVVVDVAALQSPTSRGRGIGRHTLEWAVALEAVAPDLVHAYLLDPALPPPGDIEALLASGKVAYRGDRLPPSVRVVHTCSPFDLAVGLDVLWPADGPRRLRRSATVYDLIPAQDPATHLAEPTTRLRYQVRLEAVRAADQLHAISAGVAADVGQVLAVPASRVIIAGTAPAARFRPRPAGDDLAAERAVVEALGVRRRFVLYPTGSHPRKNNEGLLRAFGRLPEALRAEVQLVLVGELPGSTVNHLHHMATERHFPEALVVTGVVDDEALLALYRSAEVVCFPSLAEGYGLPVAEALACGTPAIASDRSPIDELLAPEARFDPTDDDAIAAALAAVLQPSARSRLLASSPTPATFEAVARRSAAALAELAASASSGARGRRRRSQGRTRRPRIAFVSPFPPSESGVAAYSLRLVEALGAVADLAIDCFADGPLPDQSVPAGTEGAHRAASLPLVASLRGGYDEVIFAFGNSHFHLGALDGLRRLPGVVLAHDVRLTNLYRHDVARPTAPPGGLPEALRRCYGDGLPDGLGAGDDLTPAEIDRFGLLMAREVIGASRQFLVTSEAAAALARTEARPEDVHKVAHVPFAFAPWEDPTPVGVGSARADEEAPVITHFGIVDPVKQPFLLLEAFALLRARLPSARLRFVGPIADALAGQLRTRAAALGVAGALEVAGAVPRESYVAALGQATLAVQLRGSTNGEASAAVGDCLAAGLPTVVTAIGWGRELPDDAVVRVERTVSPEALAQVLGGLLADPARRAALGRAGSAEAERRSFQAAAEALVALAGLDSDRCGGRVGR